MAAAESIQSVIIGADGRGVFTLTTRTKLQTWVVSQVSVELATAPVGATCALRKNGALLSPLIPTGDAASGDPPVTLWPGDRMTVEFAGCNPGDVATVYAIYDDGTPQQ